MCLKWLTHDFLKIVFELYQKRTLMYFHTFSWLYDRIEFKLKSIFLTEN